MEEFDSAVNTARSVSSVCADSYGFVSADESWRPPVLGANFQPALSGIDYVQSNSFGDAGDQRGILAGLAKNLGWTNGLERAADTWRGCDGCPR